MRVADQGMGNPGARAGAGGQAEVICNGVGGDLRRAKLAEAADAARRKCGEATRRTASRPDGRAGV